MVQIPATLIKLSFCFSYQLVSLPWTLLWQNLWMMDQNKIKSTSIMIEITLTFHIMKPKDEIAWSMFITSFSIDFTIITIYPAPVFICCAFAGIIDIWCDVDNDLIRWKTWLDTGCAYFTGRIRFYSRLVPLNLKKPEPSDHNNLPSRWLC